MCSEGRASEHTRKLPEPCSRSKGAEHDKLLRVDLPGSLSNCPVVTVQCQTKGDGSSLKGEGRGNGGTELADGKYCCTQCPIGTE